MDELLKAKWQNVIDKIKDGKSVKVRRDTIMKGMDKPFGTLTRKGNIISFEPAKSLRQTEVTKAQSFDDTVAADKLTHIELVSSFWI